MLRPRLQCIAFGRAVIRPRISGGDASDGPLAMVQYARDRFAADAQLAHTCRGRAPKIMQGPPGNARNSVNGGLRLLEVCVTAAVAFGLKHVIDTDDERHRRQHLPCDR